MGEEGLGEIGGFNKKGSGGLQSGGNVLQGSDTGSTPIWLRKLGTFGGNRENGGGETHQVYEAYHGEAGDADCRQDVGDSQGGSSLGSGRNPIDHDIHWKKTRYSVTVGGDAVKF